MVAIGSTRHGDVLELNRRAAESDLLIYVNLNFVAMNGGHKSVAVGLCSYKSLRPHHKPAHHRRVRQLHGPEALQARDGHRADGQARAQAPEYLHHRDHGEQSDVRTARFRS